MIWFRDKRKVERLLLHYDWFYRHHKIQPPVTIPSPKARVVKFLGKDPVKTLTKDIKRLLGYAKSTQTWAAGTYTQTLIERLHHPTYRMNPKAVKRGIAARRAEKVPTTPQEIAQYIEDSPHIQWAGWLSTGSDEARLNEIESPEHGTDVFVPHLDKWVKLNMRIVRTLYKMAKYCEAHGGVVIINAWTGGVHSSDQSEHMFDAAVDFAIQSTMPYHQMELIWESEGGDRNFEQDHYHVGFPRP